MADNEKKQVKYDFDFSEIIKNIPKAVENREKVKSEAAATSRSLDPMVTASDIEGVEYGFISSIIIQEFVDRKISYYEFLTWVMKNATWVKADGVKSEADKRKELAYNIKYSILGGHNISEDRIELLCEFLGIQVKLVDSNTKQELR